MSHDAIEKRYLNGQYAAHNPTWDIEDSPWKAGQVLRMIQKHGIAAGRIAEIGCGAGAVLQKLSEALPESKLYGFDISQDAAHFWTQYRSTNMEFRAGDFFELNQERYELVLVLDVVEHLANPFEFLARLREHADHFIFHFPLDLSALSVWRETPLLHVRQKVGNIHYYTKNLVLALLMESSYDVVDWFYTGASLSTPQRNWKTRFASLPRRLAYAINKDLGVRLLGGETLMVLASARNP